MVRNRLYRGELVHYGRPIPGKHAAIVTESLWQNARDIARRVALERRPAARVGVPNPLKGLIFGPTGNLFCLNSHHNRYGQKFRYYVPSGRKRYGAGTDPRNRFRADEFDAAVLAALVPYVPRTVDGARMGGADLLQKLVSRIDVGPAEMVISLKTGATVEVPVTCRVRSFRWRNGSRASATNTSARAVAAVEEPSAPL